MAKKDEEREEEEREEEDKPKKRKRGGRVPPQFKKFKAPPFHGKVEGRAARRRPDRKAFGGTLLKRGGRVDKADGEPESPDAPNAPVGGAERQTFAAGGSTDGKWIGKARASMERRGTVGSLRKAMGAKEGQKIPTGSLERKKAQAKRTGNTAMMRKVQFALNVRK